MTFKCMCRESRTRNLWPLKNNRPTLWGQSQRKKLQLRMQSRQWLSPSWRKLTLLYVSNGLPSGQKASSGKLADLIDEASDLWSHTAVVTVSISVSGQEQALRFIYLKLKSACRWQCIGVTLLLAQCCYIKVASWKLGMWCWSQCHVRKEKKSHNQAELHIPKAFSMAVNKLQTRTCLCQMQWMR